MDIYIGTYTDDSASRGIYRCRFDSETGNLSPAILSCETANPSFLAKGPESSLLYAVSEGAAAAVVSLRIMENGLLEEVDRVTTGGSSACYVALSRNQEVVFAANYGDGSVMSCSVASDGMFDGPPQTIQHRGSSPHAHSVNVDPTGATLLVADLGTDRIVVYKIGARRGELLEIGAAGGTAVPGSGPRHLVFHPNGQVVYCVNELTSTVTRYDFVSAERLTAVQTVAGLPADFVGVSYAADIHINPTGTFLYTSNRGHDSIAVFRIDSNAGLAPIGHVSSGGENPRNFTLVADGAYLLAANQDSDNVVVFRIGSDGIPVPTGGGIRVPKPVCLLPV